ncbi:MAG: hypothetical protein NC548_42850 [Lachnospiraceae bacterium]|nr:hypothetical protein [Lachnospiraceae bacterium]MCM1229280.1 hypothetical protein [Ruminococcus flavefaciens]
MENSIDRAEYVLVIGSKGYLDKQTGKVSLGTGRGVKWESNIIYQRLYNADSLNTKFIPVVFDERDFSFIPSPLQGATFYNVSTQNGYDKLYWRLRGVTSSKKPELGKLRPLPEKERKTLFVSSMIDIETWNKAVWRGAGFVSFQNPNEIPVLLLLYKNEQYATKIFKDWIADIGTVNSKEDIRVALVEGDVPGEASGHYVVIGNNLDEAVKRAEKSRLSIDEMMIINVSRNIRANPTDNFKCYNMFKQCYMNNPIYYLMPAIIDESNGRFKLLENLAILKHKIEYRNIKDIKENDIDAILLQQDKSFKPYKSQFD